MKMYNAFISLVRSKVTTLIVYCVTTVIMYCVWIKMVLDMIFNIRSFFCFCSDEEISLSSVFIEGSLLVYVCVHEYMHTPMCLH